MFQPIGAHVRPQSDNSRTHRDAFADSRRLPALRLEPSRASPLVLTGTRKLSSSVIVLPAAGFVPEIRVFGQELGQCLARVAQSRAHRDGSRSHDGCDLLDRETFHVVQHDDGAPASRQTLQCNAHASEALFAQEVLVGIDGRCRAIGHFAIARQRETAEPSPRPAIVFANGEVTNAERPRRELRPTLEFRQTSYRALGGRLRQVVDVSPSGERAHLTKNQGEDLIARDRHARIRLAHGQRPAEHQRAASRAVDHRHDWFPLGSIFAVCRNAILLGELRRYRDTVRAQRFALTVAGGTIFAGAGIVSSAHAQSDVPQLSIRCPVLTQVDRAVLEARARAELTSSMGSAARVKVDCADASARVAVVGRDGVAREGIVNFDGPRANIIEQLLGAVHELTRDTGLPSSAVEKVAQPPGPAAVFSPRIEPVRTGSQTALGWGLVAGVSSELWQGAPAVALGGRVGGRLLIQDGWSVSFVARMSFGLASSAGVDAREWGALLVLEDLILSHAEIALGASAKRLIASHAAANQPTELDAATLGAFASAHVRFPFGRIAISAGPELEVLARPLIVQVDGSEAFRIPRVVAGFSLDVTADSRE
jgi:hypothetical protein